MYYLNITVKLSMKKDSCKLLRKLNLMCETFYFFSLIFCIFYYHLKQ